MKRRIKVICCVLLVFVCSQCEQNLSKVAMAQKINYIGSGAREIKFSDPASEELIFSLLVDSKSKLVISNSSKEETLKNTIGVFVNRKRWNGFWLNGKFIEISKGDFYKFNQNQRVGNY